MTSEKTDSVPSPYDYFFYDLEILKTTSNFDAFQEFAVQEAGFSVKELLRGACYFHEILLLDCINHTEELVKNNLVVDTIKWSNTNFTHTAIKGLIKREPAVKYIFKLNEIRKEYARIRLQKRVLQREQESFVKITATFNSLLELANHEFIENLDIRRTKNEHEEHKIFYWLLLNFNHIAGDIEIPSNTEKANIVYTYPGITFPRMIPYKTRNTYHLQNRLIQNYNFEHLNGYKTTLLFLYKKYLSKESYSHAKKKIMSATTWHELHNACGKIKKREKLEDTIDILFEPLFEIRSGRVSEDIISKRKIESSIDLDLIFRRIDNLRIQVFRSSFDIGEWGLEAMFYHILLGAKAVQGENVEVVEFKHKERDSDLIAHSYAIFIPIQGTFSDASYWMFFERLAVSSSVNKYQSDSKRQIDAYLKVLSENARYSWKTYEVDDSVLKSYVNKKDKRISADNHTQTQINSSRGILTQFLAYLFFARKSNARLTDFSRNIKSTDIDLIAENDETVFLVEAKTTLQLSKERVEELKLQLAKASNELNTKKSIQKVLFILRDPDVKDREIHMSQKQESNEAVLIDNENIVQKYLAELEKDGIQIYQYSDLKKLLSSEEYYDFLVKVETIMDIEKFGEDYIF